MGKKKNTKQPAVKPPTAALSRKTKRAGKASASESRMEMERLLFPKGSAANFAAAAVSQIRPETGFRHLPATRKGASTRIVGCDFMSTSSSLAASAVIAAVSLNPRNATTFPVLSVEADIWSRYRFNRHFVLGFGRKGTAVGDCFYVASLVTDAMGGQAITTIAEMKNMRGVAVGHAWESKVHEVNCDAMGLEWYSSDSSTAEAGDVAGDVYIAIDQTTNNGDITVDWYQCYDIEFAERVAPSVVNLVAILERRFESAPSDQQKLARKRLALL